MLHGREFVALRLAPYSLRRAVVRFEPRLNRFEMMKDCEYAIVICIRDYGTSRLIIFMTKTLKIDSRHFSSCSQLNSRKKLDVFRCEPNQPVCERNELSGSQLRLPDGTGDVSRCQLL